MKKLLKSFLLVGALLVGAFTALAQSSGSGGFQTLSSGSASIGGFGGPGVKFGSLDGKFAMFAGGYGGLYLGKAFMLGGGGYSLISDYALPNDILGSVREDNLSLNMSYGGPMVELTIMGDDAIHFGANTLVGFGSASVVSSAGSGDLRSGNVVLIEPGLFAEANVTNWFRISAGGSYRLVTSSRLGTMSASQLSGAAFDISFKFGKFW